MGGDYPIPLSGIAVGYAFHYLDVTYPETHAGRRILVAPAFIKNWYPENMRVQGMTGPVHQGPAPRRNTGWGRGNRLG